MFGLGEDRRGRTRQVARNSPSPCPLPKGEGEMHSTFGRTRLDRARRSQPGGGGCATRIHHFLLYLSRVRMVASRVNLR